MYDIIKGTTAVLLVKLSAWVKIGYITGLSINSPNSPNELPNGTFSIQMMFVKAKHAWRIREGGKLRIRVTTDAHHLNLTNVMFTKSTTNAYKDEIFESLAGVFKNIKLSPRRSKK